MIQQRLAHELNSDRPVDLKSIQTVAGVDVSVREGRSRAAVVVLSFPDLRILEVSKAEMPTPLSYIPGLLTFREGEVILQAYQLLTLTPDILIFDGQGQAHPRRMGIAAHIGLWIGRPTIGCGKTRLIGTHDPPGNQKGDYAPLLADDGNTIGVVLRTRSGVRPVYISCGHLCDLQSAHRITMACVTRYRLPQPIRAAHQAAGLRD